MLSDLFRKQTSDNTTLVPFTFDLQKEKITIAECDLHVVRVNLSNSDHDLILEKDQHHKLVHMTIKCDKVLQRKTQRTYSRMGTNPRKMKRHNNSCSVHKDASTSRNQEFSILKDTIISIMTSEDNVRRHTESMIRRRSGDGWHFIWRRNSFINESYS